MSDPGMGPQPPRERRNLGLGRRSKHRRQLAPCAPANQQQASVVGVSTPCDAASTDGILVFIPGLLEL